MIDTVRTLAQPYSHYLMSHRDLVIVLMGLVVMWTVGHDLLTRWRIQRLNRDEAGGPPAPPPGAAGGPAVAAARGRAARAAPGGSGSGATLRPPGRGCAGGAGAAVPPFFPPAVPIAIPAGGLCRAAGDAAGRGSGTRA